MPGSQRESVSVSGLVCVLTLVIQTLCLTVKESGPVSLLSPGEQQYVSDRKQKVADALVRFGIPVHHDSVPHIALLGSGGGQRAAVSLLGSLHQMGKDDLLDTLLYLGGVSGSGWAMTFLYTDPMWTTNTNAALTRLLGAGPALEDVADWLLERSEDPRFSLADYWGAVASSFIMNQLDQRLLSDEALRQTVSAPYPIYSAVEQNCLMNGPENSLWFELSPHESGFTELNRFIPTSQLGSREVEGWEGGSAEKMGEVMGGSDMDMVTLQGIIGSGIADIMTLLEFLPAGLGAALNIPFVTRDALLDILILSNKDEPAGSKGSKETRKQHDVMKARIQSLRVLGELLASLGDEAEQPFVKAKLKRLRAPLQDFLKGSPLSSRRMVSPQERERLLNGLIEQALNPIRQWVESLSDGPVKSLAMLLFKLLRLVARWEWGTTDNFLYGSAEASIPECLRSNENLQLIDAGFVINSPFPPFLGPRRDMDLIISLEFTMGSNVESLFLVRDYAEAVQKPFPVIDEDILQEQDWPRDYYVFPGGMFQPTVVFMPLFNQRNSRDAAEVKAKMDEYRTFQLPYEEEKILALLKIAMENLENNRQNLLYEIAKASARKHIRSMMSKELRNGDWYLQSSD